MTRSTMDLKTGEKDRRRDWAPGLIAKGDVEQYLSVCIVHTVSCQGLANAMANASAPTRTWQALQVGSGGSTRRSTQPRSCAVPVWMGWSTEGLHGLIPKEDFVQDARRDWKDDEWHAPEQSV